MYGDAYNNEIKQFGIPSKPKGRVDMYCHGGDMPFIPILIFQFRFYFESIFSGSNITESSLELEKKNSQNKQELNNERLRFYTNVTHELRTPLTLILGPLEDLLNDPDLSPRYNQKISIIHSSAIRLLNLINELLEFRKTETQNRQLTVSKSNLANLITEIGLRYKECNLILSLGVGPYIF